MTDYQPGPHIGPQAHSRLNDQFTEQPGYRLYLCSLLRQLILFNAEMAEIELSLGSLDSWFKGGGPVDDDPWHGADPGGHNHFPDW